MQKTYTALLLLITLTAAGQDSVLTLHAESLKGSLFIHLERKCWLFHPGTLPGETPTLDTKGWQILNHVDFGKENAPPGWTGIGWFAVWIKADTGLAGKKLTLQINHDGASEIFLDARPIGGYGRLGYSAKKMTAMSPPRQLIPLWLPDTLPHLVTIHYANFLGVYPDFFGFQAAIGYYNTAHDRFQRAHHRIVFLLMFSGAHFVLGFLFFCLFIFYRWQKLNLYYSLFVTTTGIIMLSTYVLYETTSPFIQYRTDILSDLSRIFMMWSGSLMLYAVGYKRIPRRRMTVVSAFALFYMVLYVLKYFYYSLWSWKDYFYIVFFLFTLDGCWSAFLAIRNKQPGAWLIAIGMASVCLTYFFVWGDILLLWPQELNSIRVLIMGIGISVLPACFSLYLAFDFARTNHLLAGEARRLEDTVRQRTAEVQRQADKLKAMDAVKSRFFTDISHEFKTPLTLIISPAQELMSNTGDASVRRLAGYILRNARRLLQLINQLLDLSRLEAGSMEIQSTSLELVTFIRNHVYSHEFMALQKGLTLQFTSDGEELWIAGDEDKLEKILYNLLSNAIKFTDEGQVEVLLHNGDGVFCLTVRDSGKGIPPAKLPYIFDRFYQTDPSDTRSAEGSGIGLSLTRELVLLMGGSIQANSKEAQFTEMLVELPYHPGMPPAIAPAPGPVPVPEALTGNRMEEENNRPLVLIVEDNEELRNFLHQVLTTTYRILTAAGGQEGIDLALEHIPNLIVTDLMMPDIDGYAVCGTLKTDERTSHIPIIILTAKTGADTRILGIRTGADAYLGKPFEHGELLALMENLIDSRRRLREVYGRNGQSPADDKTLPPIEKTFLDKVRQAIDSRLWDYRYGTDQLAAEMHLSRTQLHRKLKDLIGQAPGELIRITRLQRAHELLQRRNATVAEVAYEVGFSSPASFSVSFSRHFGFPPSEA